MAVYIESWRRMVYTRNSTWMRVYNNKNIYTTGEIQATSFNATSDFRLKKDVKKLESSLDKVSRRQFIRKDDKNNKKQIGFIAQELEEIIPEVVLN